MKDIIVIPSIYNVLDGSFGIKRNNNIIMWHTCRDVFHLYFYHEKEFFFSCNKSNRKNVKDFFLALEDKLGITKTVISQTNITNIIHVKPSSFWLQQDMRFSLFTILVRASPEYKGSIDDVLKKDLYLKHSLPALNLFLSGKTNYVGWKKGGWGDVFCDNKNPENLLTSSWHILPVRVILRFFNKVKKWTVHK